MVDNNGKLFGKISIVDLCVILLVVVAVCATVYKFGFSRHSNVNESDTRIEYVLKIKAVRDFTLNSIKPGDELYDDETNKFLGTVSKVDSKPAMDFALKSDGTYHYAEKPERYDAYVTVESDARVIDGGYYANGNKEIGEFSNIEIYSQTVSCESTVESVKEIK